MNLNRSRKTSRKCCPKILAKYLDKTCIKLNNKYSINKGGCCYVAYLLFNLLYKDGYNPKLVVYDSWFEEESINSVNDLYFAHNHYCIKLGNTLINEGDFDNLDMIELSNIRPINILNHYKSCNWNHTYNQANNTKIAQILKNRYFGITSGVQKRRNKNKSKR